MKNPFSLTRILSSNRAVLAIALVASVALWFFLTMEYFAETEHLITGIEVAIPIDGSLKDQGLEVVSGNSQTVDVVIEGNRATVRNYTKDDIKVTPNVSGVNGPGKYQISLVYTSKSPTADFKCVSISKPEITVEFDRQTTAVFHLTAKANGVQPGGGLVVENAILTNAADEPVTVKGSDLLINEIGSAVAEYTVNETLEHTSDFMANVVLYNRAGEKMDFSNLTITPNKVSITVPITRHKELPVAIEFLNAPAAYADNPLERVTLSQQTVTVSGPPEVVDQLEQIRLSAIDFRNVSPDSAVFDCDALIPAGCRIIGNPAAKVRVTVDLKGHTAKTFKVTNFNSPDLPQNLTITRAVMESNVTVVGSTAQLNRLKASDVYGEIDWSGVTAPGDYIRDVTMRFKTGDGFWAYGKYGVAVTLAAK
ncbi:MAG: hypothetical protein LBQ48_06020 [Oscillospiraceae bacterium]|nr:hypothetical protein [Oscillospiraceae bacterium]